MGNLDRRINPLADPEPQWQLGGPYREKDRSFPELRGWAFSPWCDLAPVTAKKGCSAAHWRRDLDERVLAAGWSVEADSLRPDGRRGTLRYLYIFTSWGNMQKKLHMDPKVPELSFSPEGVLCGEGEPIAIWDLGKSSGQDTGITISSYGEVPTAASDPDPEATLTDEAIAAWWAEMPSASKRYSFEEWEALRAEHGATERMAQRRVQLRCEELADPPSVVSDPAFPERLRFAAVLSGAEAWLRLFGL